MKIGFASDHRGYDLKKKLIKYLEKEYEIIDYGTDSLESVDYPDFGIKLGENVANNKVDFGIAICGSGIGISIACNKVKGVRCAHVTSKKETIMTRNDNNTNVIAIAGDLSLVRAKRIVNAFLSTPFSLDDRHKRRVDKIMKYEG